MNLTLVLLNNSITNFFHRCGLTSKDQLDCMEFVRNTYPGCSISLSPSQGYCSLTIFVGCDKVVQFRPRAYRLDLRTTQDALKVYGSFAPSTRCIGIIQSSRLCVYEMDRISGICFKDLKDELMNVSYSVEHLAVLCRDLAVFHSRAWNHRQHKPITLGVIGKSIKNRLNSLTTHLPARFRPLARKISENIHRIESLPWTLTHGDIIASNIMVDPSTKQLRGLVDWAEAETLPFGISLYGLEEVLGRIECTNYVYHPDASSLRNIFWTELKAQSPELQEAANLEVVNLSRDLGVLLWYGIAFDDGAINRVVEEGRDVEEILKLEAFLGSNTQCTKTKI